MGNSSSTLQTYENEIEEEMKRRIQGGASSFFELQSLNQSNTNAAASPTLDPKTFASIQAAVSGPLDFLMGLAGAAYFALSFGYLFNDNPSNCNPPTALGSPKVASGLCSISTPVGGQIHQFIKSQLFPPMGLPTWVEFQAIADLAEKAGKLVSDSADPSWGIVNMSQVYDSAVGDQGDWQVDATIVYVNGALTFDGLRAAFSIIYYTGAFYRITSNSKSLRDSICRDAYNAAAGLTGGSTPKTDAQLRDTLSGSANPTFKSKFGFAYGSVPPESLRDDGISAAYLKYNTQLMYLPMIHPGWDYLVTSVEQGLFSGLDVPISSIKQDAVVDFTNEVSDILSSSSSQTTWRTHDIQKVYLPADPTLNPIRQKTIFMSWYQYKINSNSLTVPVSYVYMQTAFYEELPAERRAVKQLFQILADNLREELHKPPSTGDDFISLKSMLSEYAGQQFGYNLHFSFEGDLSNPPDRRPGGSVRGYDKLLQTNSYPVSITEIEEWLNSELFRRDTLTFPAFANNRIWEKFRDDIMTFTSHGTSDRWNTASYSTVYLHPAGGTNIKQYSQYAYCAGELELDGVKVKRVYISYIGVFCGTLKTA